MSEFKGTPGPWEVEANSCYFSIESQGGGIGDVCMSGHVFDGGDCLGSISKANASLIAAAPELLEALQEMVSAIKITLRVGHERIVELGGDCDSPEVMIKGHSEIARAEAVISKALGQQPLTGGGHEKS